MSKTKKIITVLILICLFGTAKCYGTTGNVNATSGLVLRQTASKTGDPITTVGNNETVEILETLDEWYKVKYGNNEGYLYKQYVNVTEETPVEEPEEVLEDEQQDTQLEVAVTKEVKEVYPKEATTFIMPL